MPEAASYAVLAVQRRFWGEARMKNWILALLSLFPLHAIAGTPVEVVSTTDDSVGRRLVYALKEGIRDSSSLEISLDNTAMRMQAQIVTLDQNPQAPGVSTVYSLVLTWANPDFPLPIYLTQYTGYCGSSKVSTCADDLVAAVSEKADEITRLQIQNAKR
jgi:hypothetical protein